METNGDSEVKREGIESDDLKSTPRPVFIHGAWRTGSTYIWAKLRNNSNVCCYYEPLHECLRLLKSKEQPTVELLALRRHPLISDPYFQEYDLLCNGGVQGFKKYFSYERYSLSPGDSDSDLSSYITLLIGAAARRKKRPILQFNRSLLRCEWLNRHFKPINILLLRKPADIWKSFLSFESLYYPIALSMIIGQNTHDRLLNGLRLEFNVPTIVRGTVLEEFKRYKPFVIEGLGRLYEMFVRFYILSTIMCLPFAHCVIDMNATSNDQSVRSLVSKRLDELGVPMCLEDCRMPESSGLEEFGPTPGPILESICSRDVSLLRNTPVFSLDALSPFLSPYFRCLLTALNQRNVVADGRISPR